MTPLEFIINNHPDPDSLTGTSSREIRQFESFIALMEQYREAYKQALREAIEAEIVFLNQNMQGLSEKESSEWRIRKSQCKWFLTLINTVTP